MRFIRGNVWCRVSGDREELKWLHQRLSITTQGFYRGRVQIQRRYLFNLRTQRFPAGLLGPSLRYAEKEGYSVTVEDIRIRPKLDNRLPAFWDKLFPYQKEAIEAALKGEAGIIKLPTGAGKTFLAIGLASRVAGNTLFLVDDRGLVEQTRREWLKLARTVAGRIQGSTFDPRKFTVATMQTLNTRIQRAHPNTMDYLEDVDCLIVDEVHVIGAKTKYNAVMSTPAFYRIGLSATPVGRSDKRDAYVVGATGPVLYTMPIEELVGMGRLAKAKVAFYKYQGQTEEPIRIRSWVKLYRTQIVNNHERNKAIVRVCKVARKPALLFFVQIRHGMVLTEMLRQAGLRAEIVHGSFDGPSRVALAKRLGRGEIDVLLASTVFNKGVDIPQIRSAINAAGYKARIPSLQKLGRAMRVSEGKTSFSYWDLYDVHKRADRNGLPASGTMEKHTKTRAATYKKEGLEVALFDSLKGAVDWLKKVTPDAPA